MVKIVRFLVGCTLALLFSCKSEPSLQKYFVEKTENKDFLAIDLTPKMLNINNAKLTDSQREALTSFRKMNVLAFKVNEKNKAQFDIERATVTSILKDEKYQQLMKFGSGAAGVQISFVGTDEHIDEFIIYGNKKEKGFAIVRVLGKDMNPTYIVKIMSLLKNGNVNLDQLKPLQELMK
ncbi:hypothetical protein IA01_06980 [Flavobacterium psychrophilum]|uniref:DUF4252 domain-containing protein n=2 Tax=Flavobacterium psychrophilum TaxID=96345 RepID=A0A075S0V1_FLAPS|nr:DUF4252 domain-containing protein [Flavobacterium psychrophilum]AIG30227.1 hypothetical protein IA03_06980 [Flavobacterium psychrophilum]AIG32502.1 hypothetical protein IA01_06980 [Flavobacterium psychrophilum]AIG34658.1 hypothetical protein IA02_06390 [Flavobacterium psychrophilum]AIG37021.1 hypothetical protein IA04_06885 [Flavobacterium psychrophilum]AIG39285.1 hypothetical protein IA05_06970 [Flavobacterium psychrophilum]